LKWEDVDPKSGSEYETGYTPRRKGLVQTDCDCVLSPVSLSSFKSLRQTRPVAQTKANLVVYFMVLCLPIGNHEH
jgi:hypothetical protein